MLATRLRRDINHSSLSLNQRACGKRHCKISRLLGYWYRAKTKGEQSEIRRGEEPEWDLLFDSAFDNVESLAQLRGRSGEVVIIQRTDRKLGRLLRLACLRWRQAVW